MPPGPAPIPALQFDTTINEWHTCPNSGRINASNPCSEYMFLDDTACNSRLAQPAGVPARGRHASTSRPIEHAIRLWTITLEISVLMAQFPSREIARLTYEYRTLGLGYANIGGLLMACGLPYDSDAGRALCAALTAIMTGVAYATSAEMAGELGPFAGFERNREPMLRVIRNHRRAAHSAKGGYELAFDRAGAARRGQLPRSGAGRGGAPRLGPRAWPWASSTATATRRRP